MDFSTCDQRLLSEVTTPANEGFPSQRGAARIRRGRRPTTNPRAMPSTPGLWNVAPGPAMRPASPRDRPTATPTWRSDARGAIESSRSGTPRALGDHGPYLELEREHRLMGEPPAGCPEAPRGSTTSTAPSWTARATTTSRTRPSARGGGRAPSSTTSSRPWRGRGTRRGTAWPWPTTGHTRGLRRVRRRQDLRRRVRRRRQGSRRRRRRRPEEPQAEAPAASGRGVVETGARRRRHRPGRRRARGTRAQAAARRNSRRRIASVTRDALAGEPILGHGEGVWFDLESSGLSNRSVMCGHRAGGEQPVRQLRARRRPPRRRRPETARNGQRRPGR